MIRFFIHRPALVHVITIAVLAIGILVVSRSQREGFPAVTINSVVDIGQLYDALEDHCTRIERGVSRG